MFKDAFASHLCGPIEYLFSTHRQLSRGCMVNLIDPGIMYYAIDPQCTTNINGIHFSMGYFI